MLVLNNLPNVQFLNGKSTKDEEEEEEEENGEDNDSENNETYNHRINKNNMNIKNVYKNEGGYRNHRFFPQMEEIEEDKNLENNYFSEGNNQSNANDTNGEIKEKDTKITNKNLESNTDSQQGNSNMEQSLNNNNMNITTYNSDQNNNTEKEKDPTIEKKNEKVDNSIEIDITSEELNILKAEKYCEKSKFYSIMKELCDLCNNNEENSDGEKLQKKYIDKIKIIEEKKSRIPKYYYFYLLYKKKIKLLEKIYKEIYSFIINKCPELNKENILERLNIELFSTIKDSKELISFLHTHIEYFFKNNNKEKTFGSNKEKDNYFNEIIKQKDNKILVLEKQRDKLIRDAQEERNSLKKRISTLEKENKMMTEKLLKRANNIINTGVMGTGMMHPLRVGDINLNKLNNSGIKIINNNNKKNRFNNEITSLRSNSNKAKSTSPSKPFDHMTTNDNNNSITINNYVYNNNTYDNEIINQYLNTSNELNMNKTQLISLKTLKDFINELYLSKAQYDMKCRQLKIPKETLEEHMYTFLNKKYGLKNLILEWVRNIINGIKNYSKKDSTVLLFGKIIKNEQEEDARLIIQKVSESIEELLLYYIKRQNPLKPLNEIKNIFERKKKSYLFEEEWKGIIYSIYERKEADIIERKIKNFINKEIEQKKVETINNYKKTRVNKNKYDINNIIENNIYNNNYLNTINSVNEKTNNYSNIFSFNTIGNINNNNNNNINKLTRIEKYNILLFPEENNILYSQFIKIVLDNHIRFRDKQLKNFVTLFKSVDTNKDGIINEEEFSELIQKMKIFKENDVQNKIFEYLEKIDPFDNQKFTFSDCITFFSTEYIKDSKLGNEKEISILEKICSNNEKNDTNNNNDKKDKNEKNDNENENVERNETDSNQK